MNKVYEQRTEYQYYFIKHLLLMIAGVQTSFNVMEIANHQNASELLQAKLIDVKFQRFS